jgi:co-chaperonin GroES (HSP10)
MENKIKYTPFANGVLVVYVEPIQETQSGIYIPDTVEDKESLTKQVYQGDEVIAIGPECKQVKVGQRVYFNLNVMPKPFQVDGVKYMLYREGDIHVIKD